MRATAMRVHRSCSVYSHEIWKYLNTPESYQAMISVVGKYGLDLLDLFCFDSPKADPWDCI